MARTPLAKTAARGYDSAHDRLREQWRPRVEAGTVRCARCNSPIAKGADWDLGHDDHDRSRYAGPEHRACNRGGKSINPVDTSRVW
jgi:hypothetical protein